MTEEEHWKHLRSLAERLGAECPDAVFIGGLAVFSHAARLGSRFQETSHDVDLYLSITGKSAIRDRYEMHYTPHLGKDSLQIEDEDFDVYTEHQHRLAIPYHIVATHSLPIDTLRIAALEHLLILKIDAAINRSGSGKGEKDLRDLARILLLLENPRAALLSPYLTPEREEILKRIADRTDILTAMGLNAHEARKYREQLTRTVAAIKNIGRE